MISGLKLQYTLVYLCLVTVAKNGEASIILLAGVDLNRKKVLISEGLKTCPYFPLRDTNHSLIYISEIPTQY